VVRAFLVAGAHLVTEAKGPPAARASGPDRQAASPAGTSPASDSALYLANDNLRALKGWKIFELLAVALIGLSGSDRLQKPRSPFLVTT
jgi:hypothetical protein